MSDDLIKVTVADGKYTFGQRKDGACYALRYGEPWREDIFDGLTLAMAHHIEELTAKLAKAEVINGLLTVVAILNEPNDGRFPEAVDLAERFSAALAEIKGEDHG